MGSVLLIALGVFCFSKYRNRTRENAEKKKQGSSEDPHPHFQGKGELSAEERRKYELHAESPNHELQRGRFELSEDNIQELSTTRDQRRMTTLLGHELRGEECSRELD